MLRSLSWECGCISERNQKVDQQAAGEEETDLPCSHPSRSMTYAVEIGKCSSKAKNAVYVGRAAAIIAVSSLQTVILAQVRKSYWSLLLAGVGYQLRR